MINVFGRNKYPALPSFILISIPVQSSAMAQKISRPRVALTGTMVGFLAALDSGTYGLIDLSILVESQGLSFGLRSHIAIHVVNWQFVVIVI